MGFASRTTGRAAVLVAALVSFGAGSAEARTLCAGEKGLNLRAGPSVKHSTVGRLPAGACGIKVVGKCAAGGWCEIGLGDRRGWANTRLVAVKEDGVRSARRPAPVRQASRYDERYLPMMRGVEPYGVRYDWRYDGPYLRPMGLPHVFRYPPPYPPMYAVGPTMCVAGVGYRDALRLRAGPGSRHRAIWDIEPGACGVSIRGRCAGGWCPVRYRGVYGWLNASYLRPL